MLSVISVIATLTWSGDRGCTPVGGLVLAPLLDGGPPAVGVFWRMPDAYHTAGFEHWIATSTSTTYATTSVLHFVPPPRRVVIELRRKKPMVSSSILRISDPWSSWV